MPSITKKRGDTVTVKTVIRNDTVTSATIYILGEFISPAGVVTIVGKTSKTLNSGETSTITFTETLGPLTGIGTHAVRISLWRNSAYTDLITYNSDWRINVVEEAVGYYKFFSEPVTAVVYYQGSKIGITNAQDVYQFPTGSHTVEFKATGYITTATSISVQTGVTKTYTAHLSPVTAPPPTCQWKLRSGYPQYAQKPDGTWGYKWSFTNVSTGASTLVWTTSSSKSSLPSQYQCGV